MNSNTKLMSILLACLICTLAHPVSSSESISGAPLSGAPLSGAPLSGAPLSGAPLSRAPLSGAPLSGAPPSGALLSRAPLSGAPLRGNGARALPPSRTISSQIQKTSYIVEIEIESTISSSLSRIGDPITAKVVKPFMLGSTPLDSNCVLHGRVSNVLRPKTGWQAIQDNEHRFKKAGHLLLSFDTLVLSDGTALPVQARVIPQKSLRCVEPDQSALGWRDLKTNDNGVIVRANDSLSRGKKNTVRTVNIVTTVAAIPLGLVPGAMVKIATGGIMGAATAPSQHNRNTSSDHPRIKGFVNGAVGSLLPVKAVRVVACPGADTTLKRGDRLYVQLSFL